MWMSPEELCTGPFMLSPPVPVIFPAEDDELRCVILGFLQIRTSLSCSLQVCIVCLQVKTLLRSLSLSLSLFHFLARDGKICILFIYIFGLLFYSLFGPVFLLKMLRLRG
jgi:hypothetical protein